MLDGKRYYVKFDLSTYETLITRQLSDSKFTLKPLEFTQGNLPPICYVMGSHTKILYSYTLVITEAQMNGDLLNLFMQSQPKYDGYGKLIRTARPFSRDLKHFFAKSIYDACHYLWSKDQKLHNDLKLDNFLVKLVNNSSAWLMLCDFGHTTKITQILDYKVGTVNFRAPEINEFTGPYSAA